METATEVSARLGVGPRLLQHARVTLIGNARYLWTMGIRRLRQQSTALEALELDPSLPHYPRTDLIWFWDLRVTDLTPR